MVDLAKTRIMTLFLREADAQSAQKNLDAFVTEVESERASIDATSMSEIQWLQSSGGELNNRFTRITAIFNYRLKSQ